jgi:hypothetical protein
MRRATFDAVPQQAGETAMAAKRARQPKDRGMHYLTPRQRAIAQQRLDRGLARRTRPVSPHVAAAALDLALDLIVVRVFSDRVVEFSGLDPALASDDVLAAARDHARARRDELKSLAATNGTLLAGIAANSVGWHLERLKADQKPESADVVSRVADQIAMGLVFSRPDLLLTRSVEPARYLLFQRAAAVIAKLALRDQQVSSFDEVAELAAEVIQQAGGPVIDVRSIIDPVTLVVRLQAAGQYAASRDQAARFVYTNLTPEGRQLVLKFDLRDGEPSQKTLRAIVATLNRLVFGPALGLDRHGVIRVRRGARAAATSPAIARGNRSLLQAQFSRLLKPPSRSRYTYRSLGQAIAYFKKRFTWALQPRHRQPLPAQLLRSDLMKCRRPDPAADALDDRSAELEARRVAQWEHFSITLGADAGLRYWVLDCLFQFKNRTWAEISLILAAHLSQTDTSTLTADHLPPDVSFEALDSSLVAMARRAVGRPFDPQTLRQFYCRCRKALERARASSR